MPYFPCTDALFSLYWGLIFPVVRPYFLCTGTLFFLCWELIFSLLKPYFLYQGLIFSVVGPYFPCTGPYFLCKRYVWYWYEKVKKSLKIFKGSAGPYRIENAGPWVGGYTVEAPLILLSKKV